MKDINQGVQQLLCTQLFNNKTKSVFDFSQLDNLISAILLSLGTKPSASISNTSGFDYSIINSQFALVVDI